MTDIWQSGIIDWNDPAFWVSAISRFLEQFLNDKGVCHLHSIGSQEISWDDPDWSRVTQEVLGPDIESVIQDLTSVLSFATVRVSHGCRPKDAGIQRPQNSC